MVDIFRIRWENGAFQKQMHMPSRAKYILHILFGTFQETSRRRVTDNTTARGLLTGETGENEPILDREC